MITWSPAFTFNDEDSLNKKKKAMAFLGKRKTYTETFAVYQMHDHL